MSNQIQRIHDWNTLAGNTSTERHPHDPLVDTYVGLVKEEGKELFLAHAKRDVKEMLDGAADLIVVATGLMHVLGYDANQILGLVNDSNYSKFCLNEDDAILSVEAYANTGRYTNVRYEQVGDYFIIKGDEGKVKGKVLKGYAYIPPQLPDVPIPPAIEHESEAIEESLNNKLGEFLNVKE